MSSYQFNLPFKRQKFYLERQIDNPYSSNYRHQHILNNIKNNHNSANNDHNQSIIRQRINSSYIDNQRYSKNTSQRNQFEKKSSFRYNKKIKEQIQKSNTLSPYSYQVSTQKVENQLISFESIKKKHNLLKQTCKIQREKNFNKNQQIMMEKQKYHKLTEQIKKLQKELKFKKNKKQKLQEKFHQANLQLRQNKQNLKKENQIIQEEIAYIEQINAKINFFKKQNLIIQQKITTIKDAEENYQKQKELNQQLVEKFNQLQNQQKEIQKQIDQQNRNVQKLEIQVDNLSFFYEEKIEKVIILKKEHKKLKQFQNTKYQNEKHLQQLLKTIRNLQLQIGMKNEKILYTNTEIYQLNSKITMEKKKRKNFYQNLKKGKQLIKNMEVKNKIYSRNFINSPQKNENSTKDIKKQLKNEQDSAMKIKNWEKLTKPQQYSNKSIDKKTIGKKYEIIESENESALNLKQKISIELKTNQMSNKKIQRLDKTKPKSSNQIKNSPLYLEQSSINTQQIFGLDMLINQYQNIKSKSSFANKTQNRQQF